MSTGCGPRPDGEPVHAAAAERSALEHYVAPLRPHLSGRTVTELCVNRPGELWIEASDSGWQAIAAPWATYRWAAHLGRLLASASQQRLTPEHPLLSTALPDGERVQLVAPPATEPGVIALASDPPSRSPRHYTRRSCRPTTPRPQTSAAPPHVLPSCSLAFIYSLIYF